MQMNLSIMARQAAARYKTRVALDDGCRQLTYRAFDALVDQLASALVAKFSAGARIGVMMTNRVEAVMLQFALERAALVRVPVNFRYTAQELRKIMLHSEAEGLFFDEACRNTVDEAQLPESIYRVCVNDEQDFLFQSLLDHPVTPGQLDTAQPSTLCTINYTSGSTGAPKGVMLSHANWMAVYRNMLVDRDFRSEDVAAYVGPLTHASGAYLAAWYWVGARNLILPDPSPENLLDAIENAGVTVFTCVPTFLTRLLAIPGVSNRKLNTLRWVGYGAEPISASTLKKAWQVFGPILWQNYGQTEAMMTCLHLRPEEHVFASGHEPMLRHGCAGRPYSFVQVQLRDEAGEPVAPGDIGEITICADHVMMGYWKDADATAATLRDGWLYTGDLATQDATGAFQLIGRSKDMLICGGFNIYPSEIEAVLTPLEGVHAAVVLARDDESWGQIPVAFVVLEPDATLTAQSLSAQVKPVLGIKTPKAWHFIDGLPKNANGKIDKQVLAQMDAKALAGERT